MSEKSSTSKGSPRVVCTLPALARVLARWRARGEKVALVPTMGALHAGHLALVRTAQRRADRVIVSIFVNPTQFAANEDLGKYPRTFPRDIVELAKLKADLVWAPAVETMYPPGYATRILPEGAALAGLEDAFRPHFFSGVATVVAKLFLQCRPDIAVFGEKDYQQLKVVMRLARDLGLATRVIGVPIVREADGLALSSRNRYLAPSERAVAPLLYRVLADCAKQIAASGLIGPALNAGRATIMEAGLVLDYLELRHAETLAPMAAGNGPMRLLVAARVGKTRLIDNVAV
jgi:pantoate--beta-alanine ligase